MTPMMWSFMNHMTVVGRSYEVLDGYTFRISPGFDGIPCWRSFTISGLSHVATDHARGILDVYRAIEALCSMVTSAKTWREMYLSTSNSEIFSRLPVRSSANSPLLCTVRLLIYNSCRLRTLTKRSSGTLHDPYIYLNTPRSFDHPAPIELHSVQCLHSSRRYLGIPRTGGENLNLLTIIKRDSRVSCGSRIEHHGHE